MDNPKVFEFAKELGMETLALMDKIREWKLPVKNHMAELAPELVEEIKNKLAEHAGGTKKKVAKKKTVTKKTVVAKAAPGEKKTAKKKASTSITTKTVIRRKRTEEEAEGAEVAAEEIAAEAIESANSAISEEEESALQTTVETVEKEEVETAPAEPAVETPETDVVEAKSEEEARGGEAESEKEKGEKKRSISRKKEVTIGQSGVSSRSMPMTSVPKGNIVGRMDLSRLQQFNNSREQPRAASPRNLRTGFVAPEPVVFPEEEDFQDSKRRDRDKAKRQTRGAGPAGPAGPAPAVSKFEEPVEFAAAEFRKREMVFQPKKKKVMKGEGKKTMITVPKASKRVVRVYGAMKLGELAQAMGVKAPEVIKKMMSMSADVMNINSMLDFDTIALIAPEFKYEAVNVERNIDEMLNRAAFGNLAAELTPRPPIVTVMGHVDHGKTSLLDAIRQTDVASGEAGGITQHIGAYSVTLASGQKVTFIDTPGHEAFTAMRARGANVTDIAIVVVAADDGVMPQTAEAINHAKAAGVPIIIAVNKMDRPGANPDRIRQQLTEFEIVPEEWGGTNIFCHVSALKKQGIQELLEQILVQAEVLEIRANAERSGTGVVIESRQVKGRGNVATFLVKDGTVRVGQHVVAGMVCGKVRSLYGDRGTAVIEAGPGTPVEVLGLDSLPAAGDRFDICESEEMALEIANFRRSEHEKELNVGTEKMSLESIFAKISQGGLKELPIVLKTDVAGSLEAIQGSFDKLGTNEVKIKVVHGAVGGITESDVLLASTAKGLVVGFNVRPDGGAQAMSRDQGIEIRAYTIIYEMLEDLKKAMAGLLDPETVETTIGRAEVRQTFGTPKVGTVAGCTVLDGKISNNSMLRLVRDGRLIYQGRLGSLRRFKDDVREVQTGYECGIVIENYNDVKVGDVIEAYQIEQISRQL